MSTVATTITASMVLSLVMYALVDIAAIVIGLLIFFKGRAHVRKKYGTR